MNYQFESLGPALRIVVLVFLLIFGLLLLGMTIFIAMLPGKIAKGRSHPQAEAIAVCGWVGLPTGILWAIALVWAFIRPTSSSDSSISAAGIRGYANYVLDPSPKLVALCYVVKRLSEVNKLLAYVLKSTIANLCHIAPKQCHNKFCFKKGIYLEFLKAFYVLRIV